MLFRQRIANTDGRDMEDSMDMDDPKRQPPEIMPPLPMTEPQRSVPEIPPDIDAPEKNSPTTGED